MPNHRNVYISLATSMSKTGKFQLTPLVKPIPSHPWWECEKRLKIQLKLHERLVSAYSRKRLLSSVHLVPTFASTRSLLADRDPNFLQQGTALFGPYERTLRDTFRPMVDPSLKKPFTAASTSSVSLLRLMSKISTSILKMRCRIQPLCPTTSQKARLAFTGFIACGYGFSFWKFFLCRTSIHSSFFVEALGLFFPCFLAAVSCGLTVSSRGRFCMTGVLINTGFGAI